MSGSVDSAAPARPRNVVVVGGGLAGLAAATRLRAASCQVQVLEAGDRFGGRAAPAVHEGITLEAGPHLLRNGDRHWSDLIASAGLPAPHVPIQWAQARAGEAALPISPGDWPGRIRLPGMRLLDGLRTHRLKRLLRRFADLLEADVPEAATRLDDRCVRDFVRLYFGRSALEAWAEPWIAEATLGHASDTSRLLFMMLCANEGAACLPGAGMTPLLEALAQPGDETGSEVRAVEPKGQGVLVHVSRGGASEQAIDADAVLIATPAAHVPTLAGNWLTTAERHFFRDECTLPTISAAVVFERAPHAKPVRIRVPAALGSPIALAQLGFGAPPVAQLLVRPDWARRFEGTEDGRLERILVSSLDAILPGAADAARTVSVQRHAAGFPSFPVGRYRALAQLGRVLADRRACGRPLAIAGDWRIAPSIEGACASGVRAADTLLERR